MLIGIDGNEANVKERVGVGEYAFYLLKQLKRNSKFQIPNSKFTIYLKIRPRQELPAESSNWRYKVLSPKRLWTQIGLPVYLYTHKPFPDVFLSLTHYGPRFSPCPVIISVMDLSYIHFPEMFRKKDFWQLRKWTAYSIKKAKKILTISESARNDIINYYQVEESKVNAVYPGVRIMKAKSDSEIKKIRKKYRINGQYLLYVGTLQPRKNLVRLIEALKRLKTQNSKLKTTNQELKLVIAGKRGWLYEEIFAKVKELDLEKDVIFTGYVPDEDLSALYQGAVCLILVSLYEGFGFPIVEAMALGCPVVAGNISSLPEIAGEAGVLVNPYDVDDITRGIIKVLNLNDKERKELVEKGKQQAEKFSWEKTAKEILKIIEETAIRD